MSLIEAGLSFLEGLALIASPCILPVLPLVLGASVDGGKKRPFGIIFGFVASFTAFALLSRKLVAVLGLDLDLVKQGSLVLLSLFGATLLSERLSEKFSHLTQSFAGTGSRLSSGAKDGFFSGVMIGLLIGLVWTPCAGPILATVLVQVIRQESDLGAALLLVSFSLGAGLPMLAIALMGKSLVAKFRLLSAHAEGVRKTFGVVILLAVAFIASGVTIEPSPDSPPMAKTEKSSGLQDALATPYPAPDFKGIVAWINSPPLSMKDLRGRVVLVDFWTYSCINCVRTLPYITRWDRDYRDKGLVIVGVHAPEFEFEKDKANVENAIQGHGIKYPVVLDNALDIWTAFSNRYWPAHYLIDRQGRVVYTHFGEGHYAETENNIRHLLGLNARTDTAPERPATSKDQSPETYLGYKRAAGFSSPETVARDAPRTYSLPPSLPADHWALSGRWAIGAEHITAENKGAALRYHFTAGKVYLVLGTRDGRPIRATMTLNGKDSGTVTVNGHALYKLIDQETVKNGLLEVAADAPGLEAYAFTFGG